MPARQFGYHNLDRGRASYKYCSNKKKIHLKDASAASGGESTLQKGDEVKFLIGNTKPEGTPGIKKVAVKIESLTPGTLPKLNFAFHERNLNQGYVLVEPSHTKLNLLATKKKGGGGGAKV